MISSGAPPTLLVLLIWVMGEFPGSQWSALLEVVVPDFGPGIGVVLLVSSVVGMVVVFSSSLDTMVVVFTSSLGRKVVVFVSSLGKMVVVVASSWVREVVVLASSLTGMMVVFTSSLVGGVVVVGLRMFFPPSVLPEEVGSLDSKLGGKVAGSPPF